MRRNQGRRIPSGCRLDRSQFVTTQHMGVHIILRAKLVRQELTGPIGTIELGLEYGRIGTQGSGTGSNCGSGAGFVANLGQGVRQCFGKLNGIGCRIKTTAAIDSRMQQIVNFGRRTIWSSYGVCPIYRSPRGNSGKRIRRIDTTSHTKTNAVRDHVLPERGVGSCRGYPVISSWASGQKVPLPVIHGHISQSIGICIVKRGSRCIGIAGPLGARNGRTRSTVIVGPSPSRTSLRIIPVTIRHQNGKTLAAGQGLPSGNTRCSAPWTISA